MAAIKQLVHSLHSSLGIAEFQFQHHKKLTAKRDGNLSFCANLKDANFKIRNHGEAEEVPNCQAEN